MEESEFRPFGESILWAVIPGDYFFTREDYPQILVTIDDMPAVCTGLLCDFTYYENPGLVTGFSIVSDT
jgi:hypothetical protein